MALFFCLWFLKECPAETCHWPMHQMRLQSLHVRFCNAQREARKTERPLETGGKFSSSTLSFCGELIATLWGETTYQEDWRYSGRIAILWCSLLNRYLCIYRCILIFLVFFKEGFNAYSLISSCKKWNIIYLKSLTILSKTKNCVTWSYVWSSLKINNKYK